MADNARNDDRDEQASASPAKDDAVATETSGAGYGNNAYTDAGKGAPSGEEAGETDEDGEQSPKASRGQVDPSLRGTKLRPRA